MGETKQRRKVEVRAAEDPVETRYFVVLGQRGDFRWESGYATQAEAREALTACLSSTPRPFTDQASDRTAEIAVAARVPDGRSILPRSECDGCHAVLGAVDLVPILSWLWQRGRCRHCSE